MRSRFFSRVTAASFFFACISVQFASAKGSVFQASDSAPCRVFRSTGTRHLDVREQSPQLLLHVHLVRRVTQTFVRLECPKPFLQPFVVPLAMAPKFAGKRRSEAQASSPKVPRPRLTVAGKAEMVMELWLMPYGKDATFVSGDLSATPLHVIVCDLKASTTRVYDFATSFPEYLRVTATEDRPANVEDLKAFGVKLVNCPGPSYAKLFFVDGGAGGLLDGFALLYEFFGFLMNSRAHAKRLSTLKLVVKNATQVDDNLFQKDLAADAALKVAFQGAGGISLHPANLRAPDARGPSKLVLQQSQSAEHASPRSWWKDSLPASAINADGAVPGILTPLFSGSGGAFVASSKMQDSLRPKPIGVKAFSRPPCRRSSAGGPFSEQHLRQASQEANIGHAHHGQCHAPASRRPSHGRLDAARLVRTEQ